MIVPIEPIAPSEPLIESEDLDYILNDNPYIGIHRSAQQSSFARLMENEGSEYLKDREKEIFNQKEMTENQRFLAQISDRMSLRSSYKTGSYLAY